MKIMKIVIVFCVFILMPQFISHIWAPSNEPTFYGFSHFKNMPVLLPGQTGLFQIKIENADKITLYNVTPQVEVWPQESQSFVAINATSIPVLESGKVDIVNATVITNSRLPVNDLTIKAYFVANDNNGILRDGAWSEPTNDIIKIMYLSPLKQFQSGVPIDKIQCKEELTLLVKSTNAFPACVKYNTGTELIKRHWATCADFLEYRRGNPCGIQSSPIAENK